MSKKVQPYGLFVRLILIGCYLLIALPAMASFGTEGIQVYYRNAHLSPENKQKLAHDITRYHNADNLWDVLRDEFSLHHYAENPLVREKIIWYMNNQDFVMRAASRAAPYLFYILQQVKKRHLPAELVLLPIIESGYNPFSLSNVGAAGIWQLMPSTATGLGIRQDTWYDGRRDIIASTRAALNYLSYLQSFFEGNWLLAIAAYNTGEGNVLAAIRKNIREGRDTDFWSLPVAQETKDYVPGLLALATIITHPERYSLYFPPVRNAPYLAQIDIGRQINLKYAATLAGISHNKMMQLNPGFNRASTSKKGPYQLVLPIENIEQFSENLARSPLNSPINWIHYKVKSGDTLLNLANKYNTNVPAIRKMNHLSQNDLAPGSTLLIPTSNQNKSFIQMASKKAIRGRLANLLKRKQKVKLAAASKNGKNVGSLRSVMNRSLRNYRLQPGDTVYMVRSNDTWKKIASRFKVSVFALRTANHKGPLKIGDQLVIPTHQIASNDKQQVEPGDTVYMVRKGDTVEKIALKFRTSAAAIRLANLMERNALQEGESLIIPTHLIS